jgi:Fic family protein
MRDYVRWLNEGPVLAWPPVARAIGAHFYFISIHPFGDGNGRTARAIESFLLYQAKVNAVGFYSLSNFYYRRRPEYIEMLDFVRFQSGGNLTPFVTFAAGGLVEELETVRDELLAEVTLIAYRDFVRERFEHMPDRSTKVRDRMQEFVLGLSREPIGVKELLAGKSLLSLPYRTLSQKTMTRDIDVLEEEGLILRSGDYIRPNLEVMDQFKP